MRCTCGNELIRFQDPYGVRYACIVCGARYDERTDRIVGGHLPRVRRPASGGLVLVCLHCGRRWDAVARVELPPIPIHRASVGGRC